MKRLTILTATITEADGREEKEYGPSGKLIDKYIDEENQNIRNMLIKGELCNKLGQYEDIEEEYAIKDMPDLKRRLDLTDKYGELSEQLGVDLSILFKALNEGIYRKGVDVYGKRKKSFTAITFAYCELNIYNKTLYEISDISSTAIFPVKLKDYGKTWALTKEELE